jgi:capsular exopolysaccharide synthesis family protein
MERIKQAIERARVERGELLTPLRSSDASDALSDSAAVATDQSGPSEAVYRNTKTIAADPEHLRRRRVLVQGVDDPVAGAYKVLRTHVLQRMRANGWRTLGITGTREGNGKTLTTVNLGISLAREVNQTVMIVDLDLRRPRLANYLVQEKLLGISDYLQGRVEVSDILFNPGFDRLVVLPGHESVLNSSEALSSPTMVKLVKELRTRYPDRIILFDLPPLLVGDDVIAFAPNVDAFMLVVEDGQTSREDLRRAYELLGAQKILGSVLNKADTRDVSDMHGYY